MPEDLEHFTNKDQQRHRFFGIAGADPSGCCGDLETFLGPHGTYARPEAVVNGSMGNVTLAGDMPCGAFEISLTLQPGESRQFACVFGVGRAEVEGRAAADAMDSPEKTAAAMAEVTESWLSKLHSEPEENSWEEARLAELDAHLETHAWDGEWYLRAFRFDGLKFGSRENEEGRIFMNPQTWAVLSGHATGARAQQVMEAMVEHLNTPYGVMLCTPPYVNTDPKVCLARLFEPGTERDGWPGCPAVPPGTMWP